MNNNFSAVSMYRAKQSEHERCRGALVGRESSNMVVKIGILTVARYLRAHSSLGGLTLD